MWVGLGAKHPKQIPEHTRNNHYQMSWNRAMILDQQILASILLFGETNKALKFIILFSQVGGRANPNREEKELLFLCFTEA